MSLVPFQHPRRVTPRRAGATMTHNAYPFPAPQLGLNTAAPLPGGNPLTALRLENLIPRSMGCQLRRGFRRWTSNLDGEVRSLMRYQPAVGLHQLFAATGLGSVYDVTAMTPSSVTPTPVLSVVTGQPNGEWTSLNFVTSTGNHFMVAVNPGGGYWTYDGTTWTQHNQGTGPGQIDGVDPHTFTFVTVYKSRLWFIEQNSTVAWYLPIGQIAGVATPFDFGALLPNGGYLAALINWTYDGSTGTGGQGGVTNQLVVVANEGDVVVYQGDDPDDAPTGFSLVGRWFIGRVPVGNRFFSNYQADVIILSEKGMVFMSELLRGQGFFENPQRAAAINSTLASEITLSLAVKYWEVLFIPSEQMIIINRAEIDVQNLQWVYEVNNKAFATLRGIPMNTFNYFNGRAFAGDLQGNVWQLFEGGSDGSVDEVPGADIQGICVSAFQPLGDGVRNKRFLMVRTSFISDSPPGVQAVINGEWNLNVPGSSPPYLAAGENFWDVGHWDTAVWSGQGQSYEAWTGAVGTGHYGSLALRVRGAADTIFVGWQALVEAGGIL